MEHDMRAGAQAYNGELSHFDSDTVAILAIALEQAWDRIKRSGNHLARPAYARAAREIVAKRIIDLAQSGERDPERLRDEAVVYLERAYGSGG
jgi:hypothetical protein